MPKLKSMYICQQCEYESPKWLGKCPNCEAWGSFVETTIKSTTKSNKASNRQGVVKNDTKPQKLSQISANKGKREKTNISELDRVLGGGLVAGQVILLAGEPGIGKSTILLQTASKITSKGKDFFYASGEESVGQIKLRAERLGIKGENITVLEETDIDQIISSISSQDTEKIGGIVIDSIQTMYTQDLSGMAGSPGQVRECAYRIVRMAKILGIPTFIVGHVTKEGSVAGPALLMHLVDTVLWFEGDKSLIYRLLRAHKNRFGPTDEVGIFGMEEAGLDSIDSPEKIFLTSGDVPKIGVSVSSALQGTRPVLVEIQSLVVPSKLAFPRRIAQGIDSKRFEILLAVLTKRAGLNMNDFDCYLNIAGGINVKDPAIDLAICLSLASSYFDRPLVKGSIAIGEVGLLGDVRQVVVQDKRIKEAKRLGYNKPITSKNSHHLNEIIKKCFKG